MDRGKGPPWNAVRTRCLIGGEIGPALWCITQNLLRATAHDRRVAQLIDDPVIERMTGDLIHGYRRIEGHLDALLAGMRSEDERAAGTPGVGASPARSLWAEITGHNDLRFSVFRRHLPEGRVDLDAIAPLRKMTVDRHRILQIYGGGLLFEANRHAGCDHSESDAFVTKTRSNLRGDLADMVLDLWSTTAKRIAVNHDLEIGEHPAICGESAGAPLTMAPPQARRR